MATTERTESLDELLGLSIAQIDIPDEVYARAVQRYEDLGRRMADRWPQDHGMIYPQGSARLGTMTAPVDPAAGYDFDLVCRREIAKTSTTQEELKNDVGLGVLDYARTPSSGRVRVREGKRCWTLDYVGEPFHMDVLPAIPDEEGVDHAILLTDRELRAWQHSNPIEFAAWFLARADSERRRITAALSARMDIQEAPPSLLKTNLQRVVQALKRHRDLHFLSRPDDRPASIIITTLAARAYEGARPLHEVLVEVTNRMTGFVENRDGVLWVANPVAPKENFADRWKTRPERATVFFEWLDQAYADFAALGEDPGVDGVLGRLARSFGQGPAEEAGRRYAAKLSGMRRAGRLGMTTGGLLVPATARAIPPHTFHGDAPPSARS